MPSSVIFPFSKLFMVFRSSLSDKVGGQNICEGTLAPNWSDSSTKGSGNNTLCLGTRPRKAAVPFSRVSAKSWIAQGLWAVNNLAHQGSSQTVTVELLLLWGFFQLLSWQDHSAPHWLLLSFWKWNKFLKIKCNLYCHSRPQVLQEVR